MNTWHLQIREIYPEEYHFLKEFLYQAIYLPQEVEPPPRSVVEHPERYVVSEETVNAWRDNFNDYKTTEEDGYDAYRQQSVEADARKFAERVV